MAPSFAPVHKVLARLLLGSLAALGGCDHAPSVDAAAPINLEGQSILQERPASEESLGSTMPDRDRPLALGSNLLWSDDFQGDWQARWQVRDQGRWGDENFEQIEPPSRPNSSILRVHYPAKSASPSYSRKADAPLGGGQFYADLGFAAQEHLRLSYSLRFPSGFKFVLGGKLPGLFGGQGASGGNIPDGQTGFSARLMWREGGEGEVYAYLPSSETWGTSLGRGQWAFKPGQWHQVEQEIQLNQPGRANGQLRMWLDGKLVFEQRDLVFRTTPALKIDGLFFSTFFGGSDRRWATPQDTHIDFANFELSAPAQSGS